ncbi:NYN domain-containing protein [Aspergillus mulundensis]|uniref:NYN domain-containing protein n=1 Tax=Aspergillus mulundensis TaxID=1810919 RepID=A0A3D8T7R4_9EURO|nr:hypothetical protein DSM5745_01360 [Aspergillus mulundensis]RDW94038.1 hypothetical protein DSM5745_01360 [Aspergillus mulundensis]
MIPSSASSNWDFTPVINLLRSPTCQNEGSSACNSFSDYPLSSVASHEIRKDDAGTSSDIRERFLTPKLGDFGSLWELLGNTGVSDPESKENDTATRPSLKSELSTQPITILKRPKAFDASSLATLKSEKLDEIHSWPKPARLLNKSITILKHSDAPDAPFSTTPKSEKLGDTRPWPKEPCPKQSHAQSKPITILKQSKVPDAPLKETAVQRRRHRTKVNKDAGSSESNLEGESDSSVFDHPLSQPRSIPPMIPPQVGVSGARAGYLETPPSSFDELDEFLTPKNIIKYPASASTGAPGLQPLAYKSAPDQRLGMLTKLLKEFPDYAELIADSGRPKQSKKIDSSSRPIHVFVDISNIMVGFHDTMKISRNIPVQTRIRRLPLSYQNFSLILERGRSAAKKILVGSDRIAAINESEELGYEANILNRVQKIKQLTPRQVKFRRNPRVTSRDGGHGSETNDAPEERWVEQGVDEILHLKILESLLDADEPSTMVLATGDAAEAEYSGGFMKMVERALQRGWKVELVSFSQVTSWAYKKKEFRSRWGNQFRIVLLDDYIEELLKI